MAENRKAAHTPGPWELDEGTGHIVPVAGGGMVADAAGDTLEQWDANARLIAAAPSLLEVCKVLWQGHQRDAMGRGQPGCLCEQCDTLRAAIAKAEGGA